MGACHHLFPIATLGDVVRQAGDDDAGGARHAGILVGIPLQCNWCGRFGLMGACHHLFQGG